MDYLRVMILVPIEKETALEEALKQVDLVCLHFLKVRGYGCNPNFYASDWSEQVAKFELIIRDDQLAAAKTAIKSACQTGTEDDGLLAVTPLSEMQAISDL
ncbi:MAG: hypothetical protein MI864_04490 [Pseudomonadales bacterium]|nr:hypothetical protein [Pseudomonadales bacterium]